MTRAAASVRIPASADAVWDRIGRFDDLGWFHRPIASCTVADGIRRVVQADGRVAQQRLIAHDDAARSFAYGLHAIEGESVVTLPGGGRFDLGSAIGRHRVDVHVEPDGAAACVVRYDLVVEDGDPGFVEATIAGYRAALDHLRRGFEGDQRSG